MILCCWCRAPIKRQASHVGRCTSGKNYCSLKCSGLARRTEKPPLDVRRAKKAAYDVLYRAANADDIREKKREYYQRTRNPERERTVRKKNMARHVAYCRKYYSNPRKKVGKRLYDRARKYRLWYGSLAPAAWILWKLEREISSRYPSDYERRKARGYYLAGRDCQQRKRDAQISRW